MRALADLEVCGLPTGRDRLLLSAKGNKVSAGRADLAHKERGSGSQGPSVGRGPSSSKAARGCSVRYFQHRGRCSKQCIVA